MKILLPLLLLSVLTSSYGYKVLVIVPVPSRSHGALGKGIVDSLLKAGHQVTWASPFTDWKPHKNLRLIDVSETLQLIGDHDMTSQKANDINFVKEFSKNVTILTLSNKQLMDTVTKENFDAIVSEWFFSDIFSGFAAVQQVPQVLLCGTLINPMLEGVVDDVRSIPTVPLMFFDFTLPLNFWQRVLNTYVYLSLRIGLMLEQSSEAARYESVFSPIATSRGVPLPAFPSAVHNVSILFVNSHPSIAPALSLPPNVIDVAGYHIDEATALPKDIQSILDSSPQGVVYFSMGSVVKSAALPQRTREDLISILGSIPYTVLWKFEEEIQGLPKNIIVKKWWPQASVLAHPNIRLFITHGGMLSTLEAVHNGVPLLAIPVFGDQPSNARRAERAGYAIAVPFAVDMGPTLKVALDKILSDDSYYKQAKLLSTLFNKRPVHPTKLISHYVELAIESRGAYHLRSKTHLYSWYQRWMVDQLALLVLILYIIYASARRIFRMISGEKTQEKKKKVKKN